MRLLPRFALCCMPTPWATATTPASTPAPTSLTKPSWIASPPSSNWTTPAKPRKQEQEPASEEIFELAPGVLRMMLPIAFTGLQHVNMYGLVDDRGVAIIDPGLPGPKAYKLVQQRLKAAGIPIKRIHSVLVTHSHPDHFGGAGRLVDPRPDAHTRRKR